MTSNGRWQHSGKSTAPGVTLRSPSPTGAIRNRRVFVSKNTRIHTESVATQALVQERLHARRETNQFGKRSATHANSFTSLVMFSGP